MCHEFHVIPREVDEHEHEPAADSADEPSFLNDERETEVELLTDGGA